MAEDFPDLSEGVSIMIQARSLVNTHRINSKNSTPRCIITTPLKTEDKLKILKTSRGTTIRMSTDFSSETMEAEKWPNKRSVNREFSIQ